MGCIHILPERVADQIAAGEVVERPSSVVKELVENALDARATDITVELEDGGRSLIRVSDNGIGMDPSDATLALDRHATSKIRSAADLVGVATYGFRGEALSAIASVSMFELETATESGNGGSVGTRVVVKAGHVQKKDGVARTRGTSVTVKKLFFNTPARRKFLRSQRSETRAAVQAMTVLALARLDVAFKLQSDGRTLLDARRVSNTADRIAALFGHKTAQELVAVDWIEGPISVRGFVQRPASARPSGRKALLFVNGRPFRDPFLVRAAEAGYHATIPMGIRPTLFLSIGISGDRIDVNVHPAKLEVRFRDRYLVEKAMELAVREALKPAEAGAVIGVGGRTDWEANMLVGQAGRPAGDMDSTDGLSLSAAPPDHQSSFETSSVSPAYGREILQVFNTYLVFEGGDGVTIVDQHAAHERVLYERAMAELNGKGSASQQLLLPITVDLEGEELEAVERHRELLSRIGFEVEGFGGRSVVIHAVPNPHPRFDATRCFEQLVGDLAGDRLGGLNRLERFAATYACRAAVKAGHELANDERRELLNRLFLCELPPHDVHGRPTIVQLPKHELERRFGRS